MNLIVLQEPKSVNSHGSTKSGGSTIEKFSDSCRPGSSKMERGGSCAGISAGTQHDQTCRARWRRNVAHGSQRLSCAPCAWRRRRRIHRWEQRWTRSALEKPSATKKDL